MSENRVPFQRIYFISRAIRAWISAERCSPLPLFFHDRRISWQFLLHLRHAISYREKLFFFFVAREITFSRLSFSRATTGRFPQSLFTNFRVRFVRVYDVLPSLYRECSEPSRKSMNGATSWWVAWALARKSETKPIDPPINDDGDNVGGGSSSFSTSRSCSISCLIQ